MRQAISDFVRATLFADEMASFAPKMTRSAKAADWLAARRQAS